LISIYIETSIPGFYYTTRNDLESIARMHWTRRWWEEYYSEFRLVTSAAVIDELGKGKSNLVQKRIDLLDGISILPINDNVIEIVSIYIEKFVMPKDPVGDAHQLAISSFHKVDSLLTWNCKNLVNANKFNHIR